MSMSSELKKLGCRFTGESDISAIEGTSISEILGYITENLNVSNGNLIVTEYKEPSNPSDPSG